MPPADAVALSVGVRLTTQVSCSWAAGASAPLVDVCQAAVQKGRCCQDAELRACTLVLRGVANTCLYSLTPHKPKQRQNTKNTPQPSRGPQHTIAQLPSRMCYGQGPGVRLQPLHTSPTAIVMILAAAAKELAAHLSADRVLYTQAG